MIGWKFVQLLCYSSICEYCDVNLVSYWVFLGFHEEVGGFKRICIVDVIWRIEGMSWVINVNLLVFFIKWYFVFGVISSLIYFLKILWKCLWNWTNETSSHYDSSGKYLDHLRDFIWTYRTKHSGILQRTIWDRSWNIYTSLLIQGIYWKYTLGEDHQSIWTIVHY